MLKSFPKILLIIFLSIFIIQLFCLMTLLLIPKNASAISYTPQVPVPGYTFDESAKSTKNIAEYVKAIYKYAIGIVGIIAAVVLMFGGILWITAGGNAGRIGEAKAWIGSSLAGLLIALTSYLILATINPALVNFKITGITPATEQKITNAGMGCCEKTKTGGSCSSMVAETDCESGYWKGVGLGCSSNDLCELGYCLYCAYYCNEQWPRLPLLKCESMLEADCNNKTMGTWYGSEKAGCISQVGVTSCSGQGRGTICITSTNEIGYCEFNDCKICKQSNADCSAANFIYFKVGNRNFECCSGLCESGKCK